jgi:hypothetical protein
MPWCWHGGGAATLLGECSHGGAEPHSAEMHHPNHAPFLSEIAKENLRRMETPAAQNWHAVVNGAASFCDEGVYRFVFVAFGLFAADADNTPSTVMRA